MSDHSESGDKVADATEKRQLAVALVLSYGFELFLGALVLVAFALPVLNAWAGGWSFTLLLLPAVVSVGAWYVMPKADAADVPGRPVSRGDQPDLHQLVDKVAAGLGVDRPTAIHLSSSMSVEVHCDGNVLGSDMGSTLVIGLPLLAVLDRQELHAVVAHELGHFATEDAGLAMAFHARRSELIDLAGDVGGSNLAETYAAFYLHRIEDLAQHLEREADDRAVSETSAAVYGSALLKMATTEPIYRQYRKDVFEPLIEELRRLPFLEGFRQYLEVHGPSALGPLTKRALKRGETNRFDAHQPLWARLNRLGLEPSVDLMSWNAKPTLELIDRLDTIEREVLTHDLGAGVEVSQKLSLSEYDRHRLTQWHDEAAAGPELAPLVARQGLPATPEEWAELGRMVHATDEDDPAVPGVDELRSAAARRLAVEMVVLSEVLGWRLHAPLGAGVSMVDPEGHQLWPFELMTRVAAGENVELAEGWFRFLVDQAVTRLE